MTADIPFIAQRYATFNELCFDGRLPRAQFRLSRARTYLGRMEYRHGSFLIRISTAFDLPEDTVEDVILHEMIHCHLHCTKVRFEGPHGPRFRAKMEEINEHFGRHITVRYKVPGEAAPCRKPRAMHTICVSTFPDGSRGITIMAEANVERLTRLIRRRFRLAEQKIFESADPFFNRYPLSHAPVIYKIKEVELEAHL